MKITDMIITALIKRGFVYDAKNFETDVEIPIVVNELEKSVKVNIRCENMTIRIDKEESK